MNPLTLRAEDQIRALLAAGTSPPHDTAIRDLLAEVERLRAPSFAMTMPAAPTNDDEAIAVLKTCTPEGTNLRDAALLLFHVHRQTQPTLLDALKETLLAILPESLRQSTKSSSPAVQVYQEAQVIGAWLKRRAREAQTQMDEPRVQKLAVLVSMLGKLFPLPAEASPEPLPRSVKLYLEEP